MPGTISQSYEVSDKKDFPPKWAFPDLTEVEYQSLKIETMQSKTENKLDEFDRRKQQLPEWIEFKSKWSGKTPRKNSKNFAEYKADLSRMSAASAVLADEIYQTAV